MRKKPMVWMRTSKMGKKSFSLEYVITSEKKGETVIHASGSTTQIMFDMRNRQTIEIEPWVRDNLKTFEDAAISE